MLKTVTSSNELTSTGCNKLCKPVCFDSYTKNQNNVEAIKYLSNLFYA